MSLYHTDRFENCFYHENLRSKGHSTWNFHMYYALFISISFITAYFHLNHAIPLLSMLYGMKLTMKNYAIDLFHLVDKFARIRVLTTFILCTTNVNNTNRYDTHSHQIQYHIKSFFRTFFYWLFGDSDTS